MMPSRSELESLSREELIVRARRAGVRRAEVMTRLELVDEILRLTVRDPGERKRLRGLLGVARDLVASIVEQGLNLPDAAAMIRGEVSFEPRPVPPPVATVTLAEIFAAQGHRDKALRVLGEVLAREPDHEVAQRLWQRLGGEPGEPEPRHAAPASDAPAPLESDPRADSEPAAAPESAPAAESAQAAPISEPAQAPASESVAVLFPSGDGWTVAWDIPLLDADAAPSIRAVEVTPRAGAITRLDHVLEGSGRSGRVTLRGIDSGAVVRAAVGRSTGAGFRPWAVCVQLAAAPGEEALPEIAWAPRRRVPSDEALRRAARAARGVG